MQLIEALRALTQILSVIAYLSAFPPFLAVAAISEGAVRVAAERLRS